MNILSIDWDYFINANESERFRMFPDGGNERLSMDIQAFIWTNLYSGSPSLEKIGIIPTISQVISTLEQNTDPTKPVMLADSHRHIYDFIKEHCPTDEKINLVNVDYHHDIFTVASDEVNCGNWMNYLMAEYPRKSTYTWIARKDSDADDVKKMKRLKVVREDFSILEDTQWDLVYICRSGMWSPPHLDTQFSQSFSWLKDEHFLKFEQVAFDDRYTEEFKDGVANHRKIMQDVRKSMKTGGNNGL